MDVEIIRNYILYLIEDLGLSVSLHPIKDEALITTSSLMSFNIHSSSYCSYVKSLSGGHKACVCHQKAIFDKCAEENGCFLNVCYAGVKEYVYPIRDGESIKGFIAVSGYPCENKEEYLAFVATHFGCDISAAYAEYDKLKPRLPDKERLDTLILPLCKMLELAYIKEEKTPRSDSLGEAISRYIRQNYAMDLTAEHICKVFSCSRSYLSHSFKSYTGQSFRDYLSSIRLSYARQLLEHSSLSVTQISFSVGFNDSNYFSSVFKKRLGVSPLTYRKSKRGKE